MTADHKELAAIARDLYALAPADFTAARNGRVGELTGRLATSVKALRKPTSSAAAVNALARDGRLDDLLELGERLRKATADLDPDALRTLGRQRRDLVRSLADGDSDVQLTLDAIVADADVAVAASNGTLVRAGADPASAIDGPLVPAPDEPDADDDREAVSAAEAEFTAADAAANESATRVDDARDQLEHLRDQVAAAEGELTAAEREDKAARKRRDSARRELDGLRRR